MNAHFPSVAPATKQKFSRRRNQRGGGLVLECHYIIELKAGIDSNGPLMEIQNVLNGLEGNETVSVED